jgi:hypothetical protein
MAQGIDQARVAELLVLRVERLDDAVRVEEEETIARFQAHRFVLELRLFSQS